MAGRQSGFTLIELMIVVAIIGVLAAIAVPRYQDYVARSEAASGLASLRAYQTAVEERVLSGNEVSKDVLGITNSSDDSRLGDITVSETQGGNPGAVTMTYDYISGANAKSKIILGRDVEGNWSCKTNIVDTYRPKGCTQAIATE